MRNKNLSSRRGVKLLGLLLIFLILSLFTACGDSEEKLETDDNVVKDQVEDVNDPSDDLEEEKQEDKVPREHKSALNKAEIYSNQMHMSKAAIYDQLISEHGENFPEDAAQYAIDNLQADWKENARKKALIYAEEMDMSDSAIYDQLTSEHGEQFTEEEAQYAIDNME